MEDAITTVEKEKRRELVLSGDEFSADLVEGDLPQNLYKQRTINFLQVSKVGLTTLNPAVSKLVHLSRLVLHSNQLEALPEELGQCTKLRHLDLSRNALTALPESLSTLEELHILNVGENKLSSIPDLSKSAGVLTELTANANCLSEVPEWLLGDGASAFIHLATLQLPGNPIEQLSPDITKLPGLKHLDLSGTGLKTVPGEMGEMKLKELGLKETPLTDRRLKKLIGDSHSKPSKVLEYIAKNCPKLGAVKSGGGGKGKKGKGKAKQPEPSMDEDESSESDGPKILISAASEDDRILATAAVTNVRPHILCCVIKNLCLKEEEAMKTFLKIQNKLHDSDEFCKRRQAATIATHDLKQVRFPLSYEAKNPDLLRLTPLGRSGEVSGSELVARLTEEAEALRKKEKRSTYSGVHKYLYLLKGLKDFPVLLDSEEVPISFPPITNADGTKCGAETEAVLVEVTSTESQAVCRKVLSKLLLDVLGAGILSEPKTLKMRQVKILREDGTVHATFPDKNDLKDLEGIAVIREWL